jgi:alpha-1,3-mannosyltransferase
VTNPKNMSSDYIVFVLFSSNFVGVLFARTLHYQFYVWYFHQLPWLVWFTPLPTVVKFAVLGAIEVAFNVYPATPQSSLLLQVAHLVLLVGLVCAKVPAVVESEEADEPKSTKKKK